LVERVRNLDFSLRLVPGASRAGASGRSALYEKVGIEAMNSIFLARIGFGLLVLAGLWLTYTGWITKPPRHP